MPSLTDCQILDIVVALLLYYWRTIILLLLFLLVIVLLVLIRITWRDCVNSIILPGGPEYSITGCPNPTVRHSSRPKLLDFYSQYLFCLVYSPLLLWMESWIHTLILRPEWPILPGRPVNSPIETFPILPLLLLTEPNPTMTDYHAYLLTPIPIEHCSLLDILTFYSNITPSPPLPMLPIPLPLASPNNSIEASRPSEEGQEDILGIGPDMPQFRDDDYWYCEWYSIVTKGWTFTLMEDTVSRQYSVRLIIT